MKPSKVLKNISTGELDKNFKMTAACYVQLVEQMERFIEAFDFWQTEARRSNHNQNKEEYNYCLLLEERQKLKELERKESGHKTAVEQSSLLTEEQREYLEDRLKQLDGEDENGK